MTMDEDDADDDGDDHKGGEREDATFFREERGGWLSQAAPEPKTPSEPTEPMMASEPEFLKTSAEATVLQQKAAVVESAPSEPAFTEPTLAEPLAPDAPFVEPGVAEKTAEPQKPRRQRWVWFLLSSSLIHEQTC